jgi:hypothetical protein
MGRITVVVYAYIIFMMLITSACDWQPECIPNLETRELVAKIERIDVNCSNSIEVIDAWIDINSAFKTITNKTQRAYAIKYLRDSVLSMDLLKKSDYQKGCLVGEYWQILHMLGRSMLECDFPDKYVHDYLITGWGKYRDMCFSFDDEKNIKDGSDLALRRRRMQAKGMRLSYENDIMFFERKSIRLMYSGFPNEKLLGFLKVWHSVFGGDFKREPEK